MKFVLNNVEFSLQHWLLFVLSSDARRRYGHRTQAWKLKRSGMIIIIVHHDFTPAFESPDFNAESSSFEYLLQVAGCGDN